MNHKKSKRTGPYVRVNFKDVNLDDLTSLKIHELLLSELRNGWQQENPIILNYVFKPVVKKSVLFV